MQLSPLIACGMYAPPAVARVVEGAGLHDDEVASQKLARFVGP